MSINLKLFAFSSMVLGCAMLHAQNSIVLNNNPVIQINNSGKIVINNGNTAAIAGNGHIVTQSETDEIHWYIDNNTGNYTIPFSTTTLSKIPLNFNITNAGTAANGYYELSTYGTPNNNTPLPTGVTHINSSTLPGNASLYCVDRFWKIAPANYTTLPNATIDFTYQNTTEIGGSNTITEANLQAQRFDFSASDWTGMYGTNNVPTHTVGGVVTSNTDFSRIWTLVDNTTPLPIKLIDFNARCYNNNVLLSWSTASEINNDYFTIEYAENAVNFYELTTLNGAGNSNTTLYYEYEHQNPQQNYYYRLKQTDFNGDYSYSSIIYKKCNNNNESLAINYTYTNQQLNANINVANSDNYNITLINNLGQIIHQQTVYLEKGTQQIQLEKPIATNILFLKINNAFEVVTTKIITK